MSENDDDRVVEFIDIVNDQVAEHHYKKAEDLTEFKSSVTGRGPLPSNWLEDANPVMCSYKSVQVKLDLWAFQSRIEEFIHKVCTNSTSKLCVFTIYYYICFLSQSIREILLVGHRQAFAWIDDWYGMTINDVREYERKMQEETNAKLLNEIESSKTSSDTTDSAPTTPSTKKGWFSWS